MGVLQILEPTAESSIPRLSMAPRLSSLAGKRIWFLDNQGEHWGKGTPIMNPIFRTWQERLAREHQIQWKYVCTEEFTAPFRHGQAKFEEVAGSADAVINGLACCGSGTSAVIHDAVAYEQRGIPTVSLVTDSVIGHARAAALKLGMSELKILTLSHNIHMFAPVATLEESQRAADAIYDAMVGALLGA